MRCLTVVPALVACFTLAACGPSAIVDSSSEGATTTEGARGLGAQFTVDEWMVLGTAERSVARASMTTAERFVLWDRLSLEQKTALSVTNAAADALLVNDPGPRPAGSPFSVHQWLVKGAGERATLRPTLVANGLDLWNAMTTEQRTALSVINRSWDALQVPADLCATSGYPDVQFYDLDISYTRTVLGFFGNETIMVSRFTVPTNAVLTPQSLLDASMAEYDGPPTFRAVTLSTRPCDFRPVDPTGARGPMALSQGVTATILHPIGSGPTQVVPGRTYFFNARNWAQDFNDGAGGPSCQANTNCRASVVIVTRN